MDDIYVICDKSDVMDILGATTDTLQRVCHIDVNVGKLAAWSKSPSEPPAGFVERYGAAAWKANKAGSENGIKILGAPFGGAEYMQKFFEGVLTKEAKLLEYIPKLPSLQDSWLLLYFLLPH